MTWGRFCITMLQHANDLADEANAIAARLEADAEAQMLTAEVEGRPTWMYLDDAAIHRVDELRDRWRVVAWGITTPPTDSTPLV